jgi:hypothetical protein
MSFLMAGPLAAARISCKSQERFLILKKFNPQEQIVRCLRCRNRVAANATSAMECDHHARAHRMLLNREYLGNHPWVAAAARPAWP